ncbi:unnamed protein product [marine sediment metagenome]|uniref:HTH cro/C1-type domain-containing protein n=1 Tax=marine sediment metagenome TaxID=412755 RepID=X1HP77_9ZZZZ
MNNLENIVTNENYKEIRKRSGQRLKQIREYFNANQRDFAKKLNTKQQNLSNYETGKNEIPDEIKAKFRLNFLYLFIIK